MAGFKVITPPASEPVTLAEVKAQLRIDAADTDYDSILTPLITASREWCEGYQNRAYTAQTLEIALDNWPDCEFKLKRPPLQSVSSIKYTDTDSVETTWAAANYIVNDYQEPARIVRAYNVSWPTATLTPVNGIKVRYVAGCADAADVPERAKQAIIMLTAHYFDNGLCEPPGAVKSLLDLDRVIPV